MLLLLLAACGAGVQTGAPGGNPGDPPATCLASPLLSQLGKSKLLIGADMSDGVAEAATFDVRYLYLAGGLADGGGTCASCGSCTTAGVSCANPGGCGWWGCWQDISQTPGQYVRDLLAKTLAKSQLPMITYYELLHTSQVAEGSPEVVVLNDAALMTRYFNDWRFLLQQLGSRAAMLHIEPDLWGYAQQLNSDPHKLAAAVSRANSADCAGQEDSVAGLGKCLIAMVRKYAPNAKVGLHASAWGTGIDTHENTDPSFDIKGEAGKLADFLLACGAADSDYVVVEASDRDAGYYRSQGKKNAFWDATDATLPNFKQAFAWTKALTDRMGKPALWWQLPLGNMSLPDTNNAWQDNRVDYFFSHSADVARTNAFGMLFGSGESHQTNPSTDGGNFVGKVRGLSGAGGQAVCQ